MVRENIWENELNRTERRKKLVLWVHTYVYLHTLPERFFLKMTLKVVLIVFRTPGGGF